jgi:hypothetical protein
VMELKPDRCPVELGHLAIDRFRIERSGMSQLVLQVAMCAFVNLKQCFGCEHVHSPLTIQLGASRA